MDSYIWLIVFALVIVVVLGILWYKGYMNRFLVGNPLSGLANGNHPPDKIPVEETPQRKSARIRPSARYRPQTGQSTGQRRLFRTNKGMRVYHVNEQGLPIIVSSDK